MSRWENVVEVRPGVETLTITGAPPGAHLRVERATGAPVATVVADALGQAHLAFVPPEHRLLATTTDLVDALSTGEAVPPGDYVVLDESVSPAERHGPVRVLDVGDLPDPSLYDQELAEGFGYLEVRDGVTLSTLVKFPDQNLYGPPPWPTVVEYSGYGPSNPDGNEPGSLLGNLLGFATVGVNLRGTGCSGGVYDVFSPSQSADGYDVIETVARQPWVLHGRPGGVDHPVDHPPAGSLRGQPARPAEPIHNVPLAPT